MYLNYTETFNFESADFSAVLNNSRLLWSRKLELLCFHQYLLHTNFHGFHSSVDVHLSMMRMVEKLHVLKFTYPQN